MAVTDGRDDDATTRALAAASEATDDGDAHRHVAPSPVAPNAQSATSDGAAGNTTGGQDGAAHATRGRAGRIVLREVDPTDDAGDPPTVREASTVTTSLLAAFADRADGATRSTATTAAVTGPTGGAGVDGTTPAPGGDTSGTSGDSAEDATATTADTPDDTTRTTDAAGDTTGAITGDRPVDAESQSARAAFADAGGDGSVSRFANLPTVPMASVDAAVEATSDDDARTPATSDEPDGEDNGGHPRDASPGVDPWTAVSQVTLLSIGVLAVIQTVVLVIVNQFLIQSANGVGREATDVLAAHGKVTTVMLPALVGGATAAIALAVWRIRTALPATAGDHGRPGARMFGVPVPLWVAAATTVGVLGVVLAGSSAGIAAAQRTVIAAITTCVALAAAFLFAPRSLAAPTGHDDATDDDAATDPSASPGPLVGVG